MVADTAKVPIND